MTEKIVASFNVDIHMAGDINAAALIIQRYAAETGLCVTLSPQSFIYTGGREEGFRVGFINYPRFPAEPGDIVARATDLARTLVVQLPARVGRTNAKWKGEQETQEESTFGFAEIEIPVHEINTYVDVSNELLADSVIDIEAEIRTAFAEDLSEKEGLAFVWGSGVKQPRGFMDRTDIAESLNGHATNLSADALIDLLYKVPQHQRNQGAWALNGASAALVGKYG